MLWPRKIQPLFLRDLVGKVTHGRLDYNVWGNWNSIKYVIEFMEKERQVNVGWVRINSNLSKLCRRICPTGMRNVECRLRKRSEWKRVPENSLTRQDPWHYIMSKKEKGQRKESRESCGLIFNLLITNTDLCWCFISLKEKLWYIFVLSINK